MRPRARRGRTVKSLYAIVNPLREWALAPLLRSRKTVPDTTVTRRQNALALFQAFAEKALAGGLPPKGLEQAFAASLQISPSLWSQIKSSRPIGDKLARQIEQLGGRPRGWLDEAREPRFPTAAEKAFVELAVAAWRASSRTDRKALRERLAAAIAAGATNDAARQDHPDRGGRRRRESVT